MITSRVTRLAKVEGAEVDKAEGVGVAVDPDRLERNYTSLCLTVPASIAPMTGNGTKEGK